eukprot:m.180231 g.180231  ORF g.180231 m.180231 type:complete len:723 (+) comp39241_c0_seq21:908-3076(+)
MEISDEEIPASATEVLQADEDQLFDWCESLRISDKNFRCMAEYRLAILERLMERCQPAKPEFSAFVRVFKETSEKRQQYHGLLDCLQEFITNPTNREILQKLKVSEIASWLDGSKGDELRTSFLADKPSLLFAGCTSSGKSTLLNTLLGGPYLPVIYNAGTAIICEIKYSETGGSHARATMRKGSQEWKESIDLDTDRQKFEKYVNRPRRDNTSDDFGQSDSCCVKMELFLHLDFLKYFTLVDSPGVTENLEGDSGVRKATEDFQKNSACGLIYVLDASRPPEDSAQLGGLLEMMAASFPTPKAAVFVLNKWDLCPREETDVYLQRLKTKLSTLWKNFKSEQLCTINAKLAFAAQQTGAITSDLQEVCKKTAKILPLGMDALVMRIISLVQNLEDGIHKALIYSISFLKEQTSVDSVPKSSRAVQLDRRAVQLKEKFNARLEQVTSSLVKYLPDRAVRGNRTRYFVAFQQSQIQAIIKKSFVSNVEKSADNQKFREWLQKEFEPEVEALVQEFQVVTSTKSTPDEKLLDDKVKRGRFSTPKYFASVALVIGFGLTLFTNANAYLRLAFFSTLVLLSANTYYPVLDYCYKTFISDLCKDGGQELHELLREMTFSSCPALAILTQCIPSRIRELNGCIVSADLDPRDLPQLQIVLKNCKKVRSNLSELILGLQIHEFDQNDDAVKLANEVAVLDSRSLVSTSQVRKTLSLAPGESSDGLLHTLQ